MSLMLSANELADLRATMLDLLPSTCDIQYATVTTNDYGNTSETWANAATAVACRIDPYSRQDNSGLSSLREANTLYFQITLPYNANIQNGDRIIYSGGTVEVLQLHKVHSQNAVIRAIGAQVSP